jgi:hypothetical protein
MSMIKMITVMLLQMMMSTTMEMKTSQRLRQGKEITTIRMMLMTVMEQIKMLQMKS